MVFSIPSYLRSSSCLRADLPPSGYIRLQIDLWCYVRTPSCDTSWRNATDRPAWIKGRDLA